MTGNIRHFEGQAIRVQGIFAIFEPTCAQAQWALDLMPRFASVCLLLDQKD